MPSGELADAGCCAATLVEIAARTAKTTHLSLPEHLGGVLTDAACAARRTPRDVDFHYE